MIFKRFVALTVALMAGCGSATALERCAAPAALNTAAASQTRAFVNMEAALSQRHALRIVAIGSSSTEGVGATSPAATYPAQLDTILEARFPGYDIEVINKGIGGETADQNLVRFSRDVLDLKPDLVIWQIGTNDAIRNVGTDILAERAFTGIALLQAAGADIVLMEPQYLPDPTRDRAFMPYIRTVRDVGAATHVPVFARHDVMKYWLDSGQFSADTLLSRDAMHMTDLSYRCVAERLAEVIAPRRPTAPATVLAAPQPVSSQPVR
jgi:lysophospholipase L1-like esterase